MNTPPRLLAVDDDVASAELIVRVAERCGFEGFATSDSRGVMNLANALRPDVMALDICMPNIDANALFRMLAEARYAGQILIISGQEPRILAETKAFAESLGLRVRDAQQKPLDFSALRKMLHSVAPMSKVA